VGGGGFISRDRGGGGIKAVTSSRGPEVLQAFERVSYGCVVGGEGGDNNKGRAFRQCV